MYKSIEKVVAEYVFTFATPPITVKGRITERLGAGLGSQAPFAWAVSHYYKHAKDAPGVALPPKTECASREEAERLLFGYVRAFTDIIEPNRLY